MLMFTLAISCLTTSNLPWFVDLTFQVPTQYHSLEHHTLLPSPVKSTAGHCFHFGSASSFFLEQFLCSSAVVYWTPTELGSSSFSVISFCIFMLFMGFSRQEYWTGLPFPSPVDHVMFQNTLENPLDSKIKPVKSKGNQSWIFIWRTDAEAGNSKTLATWCEELTHWERPWCWKRLKAGGEGKDRD